MTLKRHWVLYILALPWDLLVAWPVVLLIRALWGKNLHWETPPPYDREIGGGGGPVLVCQMRPGSFPVVRGRWPKGWYLRKLDKNVVQPWGGTTLGHGIFYGPEVRMDLSWTRTQAHEHVHVEQHEMSMLQSFLTSLIAGIVIAALGHFVEAAVVFSVLWTTGYLWMGVAGWLTAWLRGEEPYWGSAHEESARAQDDHQVVR